MSETPTVHTPHRDVPAGVDRLERVGVIAGRLAQAEADLVQFAIELLDGDVWAEAGIRSPEHWLQIYAAVSPAHATDIIAVARRATELPDAIGELERGRLMLDQVAVIAKNVPAEYTASVTEFADLVTVSQLRRHASKQRFSPINPYLPTDQPAPVERPSVSMTTIGGRFQLRYDADAAEGALVEQAIREAKDALFTTGHNQATLADGLVEVATRSLSGVSGDRANLYRVLLHLDTDATTWIGKRGAIPPSVAQRYLCDGLLQPVWETDGHPVNVGRTQRIVPIRTRRLVEDRDQGCRYPGCTATGFVENHHLIHWQAGGNTDLDTLISLCPFHHREHHAGAYTITGTPDTTHGLVFLTPYGYPIRPALPASPPPPDPRPDPEFAGPYGTPVDATCVWFATNTQHRPGPRRPPRHHNSRAPAP